MKKVELLAPAGSYDAMLAAEAAGCDAVYMGGALFGARAYADNPNNEMLLRAIDHMHLRNKKLYLTVNTLLKNEELYGSLYDYLVPFYRHGLDAVIVQDTGVLKFISEEFKGLPIHLSTQMTINTSEGARYVSENLRELTGTDSVTRFVPSRELSLEEVKALKDSGLEVETFIHGALCYSYSGQCLMSSILGGRSGNRGRCAQPCRKKYTYSCGKETGQGYYLSLKDMCTLDFVPELIEAGIDSFKIEGRMKSYEYAGGVVSVYRRFIDSYYEYGEAKPLNKDKIMLMDFYNRGGFCDGYYKEKTTRRDTCMIFPERQNHYGVPVGEVTASKGITATIKLTEDINSHDVLEIRSTFTKERVYEFTTGAAALKGENIKTNFKHTIKILPGFKVFRIKNKELGETVKKDFLEKNSKVKISGSIEVEPNEKLKASVKFKNETFEIEVEKEGAVVQNAVKQPLSEARILEQMKKTGNSIFEFEEMSVCLKGDCFVPMVEINELRRQLLAELENAICQKYRRTTSVEFERASEFDRQTEEKKSGFIVAVCNKEQLKAALLFEGVDTIYYDITDIGITKALENIKACNIQGKQILLRLPHILRCEFYQKLKEELIKAEIDCITGFVARNAEEMYLLKKDKDVLEKSYSKIIHADYNIYAFNNEACAFWLSDAKTELLTAPLELNLQELATLDMSKMSVIIYGSIPVMVSAQCLYRNVFSKCRSFEADGNKPSFRIKDEKGESFLSRQHCRYCYNTIYNSKKLSLKGRIDKVAALGVHSLRMDFTDETADEVKKLIREFLTETEGGKLYNQQEQSMGAYTKGHYFRGVE